MKIDVNTIDIKNPNSINSKFKKIVKNKVFIISIIIVISLFIISIISFVLLQPKTNNQPASNSLSNSMVNNTNTLNSIIPTTTPPPPKYLESPTNGTLILDSKYNDLAKNKVLTAMIENLAGPKAARPQAGLLDADVVYEAVTEGNITRFMGVYWNNQDTDIKLMPIRSARTYFIDWALDYKDPLHMHIGQDMSQNPLTDALSKLNRENIKDPSGSSGSFLRDADCGNIKAREHCAYSSTQKLWEIAKARGWTGLDNIDKFKYKEDSAIDLTSTSPLPATSIKVDFEEDPANYEAEWKYNVLDNTYLRSEGNQIHVDQLTGKQLFTKTLIVEQTSVGVSFDGGLYQKYFKTIGSGNAWVFQDGKVTAAIWKRDKLRSRVKYYDKVTNSELSLDRGKMWVAVTKQAPIFE